MHRSFPSCVAVAALVVLAGSSVKAQDRVIAYVVPEGTVGTQNFGGALGMDFDVDLDILVTRLGVFDSGSDGLNLPITARLFDRETFEELAVLEFTPDDPGELIGGSRFKDLEDPIELPAGSMMTISAGGYGNEELNGNKGTGTLNVFTDSGPCSISFVGGGRFGADPNLFPDTPDGGPANRYASGTFEFEPLETLDPDSGIAYVVPEGTPGNQAFGGSLGLDFDANADIVINSLGVFDSFSDGLLLPITARLYDRDLQLELASLLFEPGDDGDLIEGSRFKDLDEPVCIPAGFHGTIVAEGYGDLEMNGNNAGLWTTDNGGCAISFVGGGRFGNAGEFPTNIDGGPPNRYAAGTFEFDVADQPLQRPNAPANVTALGTPGAVSLSWDAPAGGPDVQGYHVLQTVPGPARLVNDALLTGTDLVVDGLQSGVEHCFRVISVSTKGLTSSGGDPVCATPTCEPPAESFVAFQADQPGVQEFGGALGMTFQTQIPIAVTRLGVFDSGADGLNRTISARLWDNDTRNELVHLEFTPGDPGELEGSYRFKDLPECLELPARFVGTIVGEGYGPGEPNGNENVAPAGVTIDDGKCSIVFLGARNGNAGTFPGNFDRNTRYASGSFEFGPQVGAEFPPADGGIIYGVPEGTAGTQDFGGALGNDFEVHHPIAVTRLGVFDDLSDGLNLDLQARLYDRDTQELLASMDFTIDDPGELVGGNRMKDLDKPIILRPGFRGRMVGAGYGAGERNGNSHSAPFVPWFVDDGGCAEDGQALVSFSGGGTFGADPTSFPTSNDAGPPNRYAAGTFEFEPTELAEAPEPPTNLTAELGAGNSVSLTWQPPAGGLSVVGYNVVLQATPPRQLNQDLVTETSFTATIDCDGINACFVVRSVAGNGEQSVDSEAACVQIPGGKVRDDHFIAYDIPAGSGGNQEFTGPLGLDFDVKFDIVVTRLGAFDDNSDGLNRPIVVSLYDRQEGELGGEPLAMLEFTPDDCGTLIGGHRFKDLDEPIDLPAGFEGTIVGEGYGPNERNGNGNAGRSTNAGACSISFVGGGRFGDPAAPGLFPTNLDGGPANRYAAGTFEFLPKEQLDPADREGGIAYEIPEGTLGNQNFGGALGLDFNILQDIEVTALGVFDDGSDGLNLPLNARLYDRTTQEVLVSLDFSPDDPGELEGGSRFKELDEPLVLRAGFQGTMTGSGYGDGELNGNQGVGPLELFTNDGDCSIEFVGSGRFGADPAGFPDTPDGGPPNRYAAGTFAFEPVVEDVGPSFVRGDANSDGSVNLTDGIKVLNFLFLGEAAPECMDAGDFDDAGAEQLTITDAIGVFNWLFLGAEDPPSPTPSVAQSYPNSDCGRDPTPNDGIGCAQEAATCSP